MWTSWKSFFDDIWSWLLYVCALWKTSNIYPILAGLDIENNMSESLCKRKEKNVDFLYNLYFDSYGECRKNYLHFEKKILGIADEDEMADRCVQK